MTSLKNYLYNLATDSDHGFIPDLIRVFLLILSGIYGFIVKTLSLFFGLNPRRLNCKVISVGNITLGGTGKTSLVELVANYLKNKGYIIAVLSRGYQKPSRGVVGGERNYQTMGDEPYMLSLKLKNIPVIVDQDRLRAADMAMKEFGAETVILDDGFQQWRMQKDLDIVTIDASNPFGNRKIIPRGILREPLGCLSRADILFLTKTDLCRGINEIKTSLAKINPTALVVQALYEPVGFMKLGEDNIFSDPSAIKDKSVALVSGIADPGSFENMIKGLGAHIGLSFKFADHYHYSQNELDAIITQIKPQNISTVITTEKDAVKLKNFWRPNLYKAVDFLVLRVRLKIIENEERFLNRLLGVYSH